MPAQRGHLVLADISGYTAFVADTELEHSREILNELLETLVRGLSEHLVIGQIEGDAIFALGQRLPPDPLAWLEECFFRFHRHLNLIKRVTTCPCRACANVGGLTLKFVWHHGEWMPQRFGDKETYVGNAVNAVHRLLKNKVPSREYVLATRDAIEQLPESAGGRFTAHREEYDLGAVECGWIDLAPLRDDPRSHDEVRTIDRAQAQIEHEIVVELPKDQVWAAATDPASRQRWMGVQRVDFKPGARHTLVGAEYHCVHGPGQVGVFRVAEALEPDRMTMTLPVMGLRCWATVQLEELDPRRTRLITRYRFDTPPGPIGLLRRVFVSWLCDTMYFRKYPGTIAAEAVRRGQLATGGAA